VAGRRHAIELAFSEEDVAALEVISRSRREPASRVERARMLLAYRENHRFLQWGRPWVCTTRRSSAALSGRWPMVRWRHKHGSWLNLIEGFFSKLARSVLRHIRVESKQELKDRIMAAMDEFNRYPVVHTWSYKLDQAA
jgi:hypothetical protein